MIVLASSYVGLYSVVAATGLFDATVLNLGLAAVPDLLMVSATVYVMSLRRPVTTAITTVQPPVVVADHHPEQPVGDQVGDSAGDLAERVHAETGTTKSVEAVAEVLRLADGGASQRAIAQAVGVDRSLVRRWTQAAKDMQDDQRRPALVAVSE
ncbi:helix-turn-helix domain-containing protein [Gordonia malaquae]|uniref:helix-turn-helix domain-containing protein n=1 Tax=Gordonia malaquae TaxID=410332 RepID=UPI0030C79951